MVLCDKVITGLCLVQPIFLSLHQGLPYIPPTSGAIPGEGTLVRKFAIVKFGSLLVDIFGLLHIVEPLKIKVLFTLFF
jgi:hypothetical protein